ncbi:MAG TPA: hypothetical protein VM492_08500 [Sumerlaeia bacterium]|nr:hypothetical protein [Sumerlaeia bacterium]
MTQDLSRSYQSLADSLRRGKSQGASVVFQELVAAVPSLEEMGREVGRLLAAVLDDFHVSEVNGFVMWLRNHPAEDVAVPALEFVQPELAEIKEWSKTLRDIASERQARDLRATVRSRDVSKATEMACEVIKGGATEAARRDLARRVGAILGSLDHDAQRVDQVMKNLERHPAAAGLDQASLAVLHETRRETQRNLTLSEMGQREMQWNRVHTESVVQLTRSLPGRMVVSEPTQEEEDRFYRSIHALIAAYYLTESVCDFLDVMRIVREFCPTDPRKTGPVEGVEDIAFLALNPAGKLVSVRALRRLGEKSRLADTVLTAAKRLDDPKAIGIALHVMGGLANPKFFDHLNAALNDKKLARFREVALDAIGRIGDPHSVKVLFDRLSAICKVRILDPPARERIMDCVAALGRVARHPKTSDSERNAIVLKTFKTLPKDHSLARAAVGRLCAYNPAGLSPECRRIAIGHLVDGLWTQDPRTKLDRGKEGETTELGFRQEIVDILVSMGNGCLDMLLAEAEQRPLHYSGAYLALGEALGRIGDERALPFLQKLLLSTLTTNESAIPEHLRETYFDAARGAYVPLTRDKVAHALTYAIHRRCGESGKAFLSDMADRFRTGTLESPGSETMGLLGEALIGKGESLGETEGLGEELGGGPGGAAGPAKRPREDEPLESLIRQIRGRVFFGTTTRKRVAAIQEAAARGAFEAISPLCRLLGSDKPALRGAAEAALAKIARPGGPAAKFRPAVFEILEVLRKASGSRAKAIARFIVRLRPDRDPLNSLLMQFLRTEKNEKMKKKLADVFRLSHAETEAAVSAAGGPVLAAAEGVEDEEGGPSRPAAGGDASAASPESLRPGARTMAAHNILALRREYYQERKAWIAGGKQGPEPKRPPGI